MDTTEVVAGLMMDRLRAGDPIEGTTRGYSMWPRFVDGSLVRVEPCTGRQVRAGDVVLFERDGRLVLHRALRVAGSRVLLKGDACVDPDGWIAHERVVGRLARRSGDQVVARLSPRLGPTIGLASVIARRLHGFTSKF